MGDQDGAVLKAGGDVDRATQGSRVGVGLNGGGWRVDSGELVSFPARFTDQTLIQAASTLHCTSCA